MTNAQAANRNLLQRVQDLLRRKPNSYDVLFCVGPAQKKVKAVRILLEAASSALEKKFEFWNDANVRLGSGRGIPIPDFDPEAFEVFVKLTMLDEWTPETLKNLNLQPGQILNLVSICRAYEMENALLQLEELMKSFYSGFSAFKNTEDFLRLSYSHLLTILSSDNLPMKELDVFECACRWAKGECATRQIEEHPDNLRLVLGDCIFEIRFPLMTAKEFTQCVKQHKILTAAEGFEVLNFIVSKETGGSDADVSQLPFKTKGRALQVESEVEREVKPNFSTLSLTTNSTIVDTPRFICDGNENVDFMTTRRKILVYGVGFPGPIDSDANYDVTVRIYDFGKKTYITPESNKKQIFAQKGEVFRFMFDQPVTLEEGSVPGWTDRYKINYSLKGPNTKSIQRSYKVVFQHDGGTELSFGWVCNQLAEILFTNV